MATRKIDQNTGFIQFSRSEEDKLLISLKEAADLLKSTEFENRTILESGGADYIGRYTKYGNGDVKFWGIIDVEGPFSTGSTAQFKRGFHIPCIETVSVVVSASMYDGSGGFSDFRARAYLNGTTTGNFYGHVRCEFAPAAQDYIRVHYQAEGRWK